MSDRAVMFIVNPDSRGGKTGKSWKKQYNKIKSMMDIPNQYVIADGIGSGVDKTLDAIQEGYTDLIVVGGDGSINEVVNGIYQSNKNVNLGFIRSGTANDYLTTISWPIELKNQIQLIKRGETALTPVIRVIGDVERICMNVADTGIGAHIAYSASVERRLKWIKGPLKYHLLSARGIFKWKNIPSVIKVDDREISGDLTFFMSGFSKFSGSYIVLPQSERFGEKMAYTIAMNFSKKVMVKSMGILKKGTQTEELEGVYMGHSSNIVIEGDKELLFEVDGEPFSFNSSKIKLESIPNRISVFN